MIRPVDIQEKEFTRAVRGYKEEEVNAFLDEITLDLERLLNELRETREENARLVEELERHRGSEGTVVETLEAAKSLMADISASAEKRATILLKNAELDAELMKKEARETAEELTRESEQLRTRFLSFRTKYKQLLEQELSRFDSLSMELFPELDAGPADATDVSGAVTGLRQTAISGRQPAPSGSQQAGIPGLQQVSIPGPQVPRDTRRNTKV